MILRSLLERGRTWSLRRKMEERRARERGGVERWVLFPPQACWSADATVTYSCEDTQHTGCSDVLVSSECAGLQSCKCKWMHLRVSFTWWCFRWIPSLPNRYLGQKTDEGTFYKREQQQLHLFHSRMLWVEFELPVVTQGGNMLDLAEIASKVLLY